MAVVTNRQRSILSFIAWIRTKLGETPSVREIGREFEISSTNGVHDHVTRLEQKGLLKRGEPYKSKLTGKIRRHIEVTPEGWELVDDDYFGDPQETNDAEEA